MEDDKWEFNSILINLLSTTIYALNTTFLYLSSLNSDPLFSIVITSYTLLLLYLPGKFVAVVSSPVLNSTAILLIAILRLGVVQRVQLEVTQSNLTEQEQEQTHQNDATESNPDNETEEGCGFDSDPGASFVEWHVGAPLEVIFEESEGEEDDRNDVVAGDPCFQRYPSLSLYYPESDSEDSSDGDFAGAGEWESRERVSFRWDEEDREGLIEIAIDGKRKGEAFRVEEENMIEIDISPARIKDFADEKW